MDIVPKKDRVLANCFTTEHVPKGSGPWLLNPRTLTGGMQLLTRYRVGGVQVVLLVEPFECFTMMGWCRNTRRSPPYTGFAGKLGQVIIESSHLTRNQCIGEEM